MHHGHVYLLPTSSTICHTSKVLQILRAVKLLFQLADLLNKGQPQMTRIQSDTNLQPESVNLSQIPVTWVS